MPCIKDIIIKELEDFHNTYKTYEDMDLLRAEMAQLSEHICDALGISSEAMHAVSATVVVQMEGG